MSASENQTLDAWAQQKRTALYFVSRARLLNRWLPEQLLSESEYDKGVQAVVDAYNSKYARYRAEPQSE